MIPFRLRPTKRTIVLFIALQQKQHRDPGPVPAAGTITTQSNAVPFIILTGMHATASHLLYANGVENLADVIDKLDAQARRSG